MVKFHFNDSLAMEYDSLLYTVCDHYLGDTPVFIF